MNRNAGEVQTSEQEPGKSTFTWNVTITRYSMEGISWDSPSFFLIDRSGVKHDWKLEFFDEGCESTDYDRVTIRYLGEADRKCSRFFIKFCVSSSIFMGIVTRQNYDNMDGEGIPHDFSEEPFCSIKFDRLGLNTVKVMCTIIGPQIDGEQVANTPNVDDVSLKIGYELLLENGDYSDVTFIVDNQELKLHKNILSSRSAVFATMFNNDFEENASNEVHIEDQSYEVMKEFFRYIYAAKIHDIENHAIPLLHLSDKYAVKELKSLCEKTLMKFLQNENALEYLYFANLYNAKNFATTCVEFILSNRKEIVNLPGFDMNVLPSDLRNELFKTLAQRF